MLHIVFLAKALDWSHAETANGDTGLALTTAIVAAIASAIAAIASLVSVWFVYRQVRAADRATTTTLFLQIAAERTHVYKLRNRAERMVSPERFFGSRRHGRGFRHEREWNELRRLFGFYEFLGICVERGLISSDLVFSLVSIDADLWEKFRPHIEVRRSLQGTPDLYEHWERLAIRSPRRRPG